MPQNKVFLLDAYALIYRGYFAFAKNPRINSKGLETSAILGFLNSLMEILRKEKPSHISVVFDTKEKTKRHIEFREYKANRQKMPEAIQIAIPYIFKILDAFNIKTYAIAGYEADDIIGTLAKKIEKLDGYETFIMTPDKDYAQLISDKTFMYRPARMGNGVEIWNVKKVCEKFGVTNVQQVIDYLGMMGDAVDNIPGLPGVGDKTAKKFIKAYGSMEELFKHTKDLKGKLKEKVESNKEQGLLSKKLATIDINVPIEKFNIEHIKTSIPNIPIILKIFDELEFRKQKDLLIRDFNYQKQIESTVNTESNTQNKTSDLQTNNQLNLFTDVPNKPQTKTISKNNFYQVVNTQTSRKLLINLLKNQPKFSFEIQTNEAHFLNTKILGISFSYEKNTGYFVTIKNEAILQELKPIFENEHILKIGYDLKRKIQFLRNYGVKLKGNLFDPMVAHYLLQPESSQKLDAIANAQLQYQMLNKDEIFGKGKNAKVFENAEIQQQMEYSIEKADISLQLQNLFEKDLKKEELYNLFYTIEIPLIKVLADIEYEGINLNTNILKEQSKNIKQEIEKIKTNILKKAGTEFNLDSPKQLGEILFEKLKISEKSKKTKTGQYSTSEESLSDLKHIPIVENILQYRSLQKLKSTYIDALPNEVNYTTKRVHSSFNQSVTATGRLSSTNPNLQNIPIRTERGRKIREAFIPKNNNYILLAADYSQIELRLFAEVSKEKNMINAFLNGEDIHLSTASKVFNIEKSEVSKEQRSYAKTVNFGIIYGVSAFGLSKQTNLSRKEAKAIIESHNESFPALKKYMSEQITIAEEKKFVTTIKGRKRFLRNINSRNGMLKAAAERIAINTPIQGSAADIIKMAMIEIHKTFKKQNLKSKMLLQVHDELVFDVYKEELNVVTELIKSKMESVIETSIPLTVDIGTGNNWLEAH